MSSRIRQPEIVRLEISEGDWIEVRKYLTAGEVRRMHARMMHALPDGKMEIDRLLVRLAKTTAYLLDWSITDANDRPVIIRDQSDETVAAILDMLDPDAFEEIWRAIDAHEDRVEAEKKLNTGAAGSGQISLSRAPLVGAMTG